MKPALAAFLLLAATSPLPAAVIYSGTRNIDVAWNDLEGISVNLATGQIDYQFPVAYEDGP